MKDKALLYDQIEAFLNGRLTPDAQEVMQKAIAEDPELAREVELRRLEFDISEELIARNIRDQLHRLRSSPPPESPPIPPVTGHKFRNMLWIIAAMLCIVAIGVYWWNVQASRTLPGNEQAPASNPEQMPPVQNTPQSPSGPQAGHEPTQSAPKTTTTPAENMSTRRQLAVATELYRRPEMETLRGTAPASNGAYELALSAWEKQDYSGVIAALQNVPAKDSKWIRASTLRAHAQFNLKQFASAAQSFSDISDSKIRPWSEEADWYVLLALLADGKGRSADFRTRFGNVLSEKEHPYAEQAAEIKRRLEGR